MAFFRALVRVFGLGPDVVRVVIPGLEPRHVYDVPRDSIPFSNLRVGQRLHARVEFTDPPTITDWEPE